MHIYDDWVGSILKYRLIHRNAVERGTRGVEEFSWVQVAY